MIKWGEFRDGDRVIEAFLPEHEAEPQEWLLRVSRLGHVIKERRIGLTWPPRFGPDRGDVVHVEAELEALIGTVDAGPAPTIEGTYTPGPRMVAAPDPILHASLQALLDDYLEAIASLGVKADQATMHLELSEGLAAEGLYPMAITRKRDVRMNRMVALAALVKRYERLVPRKAELLAAILAGDIDVARKLLADSGIGSDADAPAPLRQ